MYSRVGLARGLCLSLGFTISSLGLGLNSAAGQDFKNSIASTDFDFITTDDPSTFESLTFVEKRKSELPDKRDNSLWREAYVFEAAFADETRIQIFIDAQFGSQAAAQTEAERYVHPLGRLPEILRKGLQRLCVHQGGPKTTAFSDIGLIVVYSENASVRISNHDLEETLFHESVHAVWDQQHAASPRWRQAQLDDQGFITDYAKANPSQEDLAETALFAFAILQHPERLPDDVREKLIKQFPARIKYIGELFAQQGDELPVD